MGILKALQSGMAAASAITRSLAGDSDALSAYAREVTREFARYLGERRFFYARERRWPEAPFWRRRYVEPSIAAVGLSLAPQT
jgi:flavin-dependent dehydrogenase